MVYFGSSLPAAFVDGTTALIVCRAVSGVGAALIMPATLSIITNTFGPDQRGRAVGLWAGVAGGSGGFGVVLSGALLEGFSWRSIFVVNTLLSAAILLIALRVVPATRGRSDVPLDPPGTLFSVLGLTALVYAIISGGDEGWLRAETLGAALLGVLAVAHFVVVERRSAAPLLRVDLFRIPAFGSGALMVCLQFFSLFGFLFVVLQYLQDVRGFSPFPAGLATLPFALPIMVTAPLAPALAVRLGLRRLTMVGFALMTAAFLVLAQVELGTSFAWFAFGQVLFGLGFGLTTTPATTTIVSSLPPERQGIASSVNDVAREFGGAVGIAVFGSLLTSLYSSGVDKAAGALPPPAREGVRDSITAATEVARSAGPAGKALVQQAQSSFVDGMSLALYVAAAVLAVGTLVLARTTRDASADPGVVGDPAAPYPHEPAQRRETLAA